MTKDTMILNFLGRYPSAYFPASRIGKETGLSPFQVARICRTLKDAGIIETIKVGMKRPVLRYRINKKCEDYEVESSPRDKRSVTIDDM